MKGNKKLLIVAVLLLLVAVSYTTYAIYKTSVAGKAEVSTAVWNVKFTDGTNEITTTKNLALTCENNAHVKNGKIAPGATCTGTVTIDATGTEVDVAYTVQAGTPTATSGPLSGAENDWTVNVTDNGNGQISYEAGTQKATVTVSLAWDDVDDSVVATGATADVINDADTALNGTTITVPLTLTAKQVVE